MRVQVIWMRVALYRFSCAVVRDWSPGILHTRSFVGEYIACRVFPRVRFRPNVLLAWSSSMVGDRKHFPINFFCWPCIIARVHSTRFGKVRQYRESIPTHIARHSRVDCDGTSPLFVHPPPLVCVRLTVAELYPHSAIRRDGGDCVVYLDTIVTE